MYVAITRAEEKLYLTSTKTRYMYGHRDYMLKSRFVAESGFAQEEKKFVFNNATTRTLNNQVDFVKMALKTQQPTLKPTATELGKFKVNQVVRHTRYGEGKIVAIDTDEGTADINFENFGLKTLILELAPIQIIKSE